MEVLSWVATLVVLTSFTLDGRKLRWVSSLGCSMWVIWGLMKEGKFPQSIKISQGVTAWNSEDIHRWVNEQSKKEEVQ